MQDRDGDFDRYFFVRDGNCAEIRERAADDQAVLVLCALLRDGLLFVLSLAFNVLLLNADLERIFDRFWKLQWM